MEKYTDTSSHSAESDSENASLINSSQVEREAHQKKRQSFIYITLFNLFLFTLSLLTLTCAVMSQRNSPGTSFAQFMDQHHVFSPATNKVEYSTTTFAFAQPMNSSKYVGTSEAVDDAWREIAYVPDQMVSVADFHKLEKPADALQVTDPRTGETGYRVGMEVFHQLHCLNLLRMATYPEHYAKLSWSQTSDKPENVRAHLDHCIEVLRVNLQCFSDVNVFTFHPKPDMGYWPDYNNKHVCRNFDSLLHWARDNAMPEADV